MFIIRFIIYIRLVLCYLCFMVYVFYKFEYVCSVFIIEMFRNVFEEKNIVSVLLGNVMKYKVKWIEI